MSKRDTMIRALCKSLGVDYRVTTIDLERVIYRDFGNGFNVEISGMHTSSMKKKATIYLWYGDTMTECIIVKTVRDIPRELIGESVEELMKYSNLLIAQGYDSYDKLFRLKYGKTINYAGGVKNMTHRIFYGTDDIYCIIEEPFIGLLQKKFHTVRAGGSARLYIPLF